MKLSKNDKILGGQWFCKEVRGEKLDNGVTTRRTLKDLCELLKISYNTAKVKQDKVGGITIWVVGDSVFEIWKEAVK